MLKISKRLIKNSGNKKGYAPKYITGRIKEQDTFGNADIILP